MDAPLDADAMQRMIRGVVHAFFEQGGKHAMTLSQIDSFNCFLRKIPHIITQSNPILLNYGHTTQQTMIRMKVDLKELTRPGKSHPLIDNGTIRWEFINRNLPSELRPYAAGECVEYVGVASHLWKFIQDEIYAPFFQIKDDPADVLSESDTVIKPSNLTSIKLSDLKSGKAVRIPQSAETTGDNSQEDGKKRATNAALADAADRFQKWANDFIEIRTVQLENGKHRHDMEINIQFSQLKPPSTINSEGKQSTALHLFPNEARLKGLTYSASLFVNVSYQVTEHYGEGLALVRKYPWVTIRDVNIGAVPIMIGCDLCVTNRYSDLSPADIAEDPTDPGGYFIINGTEKVVIAQQRQATNVPLVWQGRKTGAASKPLICTDIKSAPVYKVINPKANQVKIIKPRGAGSHGLGILLRVSFPHIKTDSIPIAVVFRALGYVTDESIIRLITCHVAPQERDQYLPHILPSLEEAAVIKTAMDAKLFLAKDVPLMGYHRDAPEDVRRLIFLKDILDNDFLPHQETHVHKKALFLGYMAAEALSCFLGKRLPDNGFRDNYMNIRVDTTGALCEKLLGQYWTIAIKDMKLNLNQAFKRGRSIHNLITDTNVSKIIKSSQITTGMRYALATGHFGLKANKTKQGVAQVLNRLTLSATLSSLRRTKTNMERNASKIIEPRQLHPSQIMTMCPAETPEGEHVGLVRQYSILTLVTTDTPSSTVRTCLDQSGLTIHLSKIRVTSDDLTELGIMPLSTGYTTEDIWNRTRIHINGDWSYITAYPNDVVEMLRDMRGNGQLHPMTSISWNIKARMIDIYTDAGRLVRPLFLVERATQTIKYTPIIALMLRLGLIQWRHLFYNAIEVNDVGLSILRSHYMTEESRRVYPDDYIQYVKACVAETHLRGNTELLDAIIKADTHVLTFLDTRELTLNAVIALSYSDILEAHEKNGRRLHMKLFTHCEIDPAMMAGILAGRIPWFNFNQSPRNCYQSSMDKQAISMSCLPYLRRFETFSFRLRSSQLPLVDSYVARLLPMHFMPSGINAFVGIASYTGYNMEDSTNLNKDAIDLGFAVVDASHAIKDEERKRSSRTKHPEQFTRPTQQTRNTYGKNYSKLLPNGEPMKNQYFDVGDVVIGKTHLVSSKTDGRPIHKCCSTDIKKAGDRGYVDDVFTARNSEGYRFIRVRIRSERTPVVGDKFASRHGQKGTCGMIYRGCDLPFVESGISPDIIINPNAIPSRMTIAHLLECLMSSLCACLGRYGDATAFQTLDRDQLGQLLQDNGYHSRGDTVMYSGLTGEQLMVDIFFGPTYYQRLKHMVNDKSHARAIGPYSGLTRQPVEGRARHGGLRAGEMERDCWTAYGAAGILKERMFDSSDPFEAFICKQCGMFAPVNPRSVTCATHALTRQEQSDITPVPTAFHSQAALPESICSRCNNTKRFSRIFISYSTKLLLQELNAVGIGVRLDTHPFV